MTSRAPDGSDDAPPELSPIESTGFWGRFAGNDADRVQFVTELMRAISREDDPQRMVQVYGSHVRQLGVDRFTALSRADLEPPQWRITRNDLWGEDFNPWLDAHTKPVYTDGLLGKLLYGGQAVVIDDLHEHLSADDPAAWACEGMRSLMALPTFTNGEALHMTVLMRRDVAGFRNIALAEHLWISNLFGRGVLNLRLTQMLGESNAKLEESNRKLAMTSEKVDQQLHAVGEIQRTLLPESLPEMPGLKLATFYRTSEQAGGDYYDFFPFEDGRLGILIADVSGHGTPAAVIMAVCHAIAHVCGDPPDPSPPDRLIAFLNRHLCERYTRRGGVFVTAFYAIYDPRDRSLTYCNAGHNPPRVKKENKAGGQIERVLDEARSLPLGIHTDELYHSKRIDLSPGDVLVLYTDGITEARPAGSRDLWGTDRLDQTLIDCSCNPPVLVEQIIAAVDTHVGTARAGDDQTLVIAKVT